MRKTITEDLKNHDIWRWDLCKTLISATHIAVRSFLFFPTQFVSSMKYEHAD